MVENELQIKIQVLAAADKNESRITTTLPSSDWLDTNMQHGC